MKFVQEKFQVNEPNNDEDSRHEWVSSRSARTKKGTPGREGRAGGDWASKAMDNAVNYNSLPPGMDIDDQELIDSRVFNQSTSGSFPVGKNAGDITQNVTAKSARTGFNHLECCPTDDMYTREHNDAFYDSIEMDGVTGFVERNNYLDRL